MPRSTYEQMDGGPGPGGGGPGMMDGGDESPMSLDDYERPPLRHVDKYLKAELPCISSTRYTIALMTCIGFIISFGMRCNLGMAKLSSKPVVSRSSVNKSCKKEPALNVSRIADSLECLAMEICHKIFMSRDGHKSWLN